MRSNACITKQRKRADAGCWSWLSSSNATEHQERPLEGEFVSATEYLLPPFALSSKEFGGATEYEEPPFALIGLEASTASATCSNNAKNGTLRCSLGRGVLRSRRQAWERRIEYSGWFSLAIPPAGPIF